MNSTKREVEILSQIEALTASKPTLSPLSTEEEFARHEAISAKIEALYARLDAIRDGSAVEITRMIKTVSTQPQPSKTVKVIRTAVSLVTLAVHAAYFFGLV